ncbi:anti-sigma factor [Cellulosimicrobium terreum]|nr:anti-sigma factor [Cellulosimicrobium terreum]
MQHIDDETLALLALGEDVLDDDASAHLATCPACGAAVDDLARVVDGARSAEPADRQLVAPGPDVWARIEEELGLGGATGVTGGPTDEGTIVPLTPRRRRAWLPVAAAACLALVAGVAGGAWWATREEAPPETTLATAELAPLPDWPDASGQARLEETPDGRRQVVVTVDAPVPEGTFREVWLLAPDVSGLVSLGVLEGAEGTFDVPAGLDVAAFPVVDVSEEHFDGDPAHSGDSVVRGPLDV